jgi:hypothetical protein
MDTHTANSLLPQKATSIIADPRKLNYLFVGPPKFGKTTFMSSIPDALLLAFEMGHAFQQVHKVVMDAWDRRVKDGPSHWEEEDGTIHATMVKMAELLEASDRFPFVIFDTADMAAKMCSDYHLALNHWEHAKDGGDYGAGYDIVQNRPFRHMVGRIMKTGRGVGFITHSQVNETKLKNASSVKAKKETTLPGGIFKFLHTQADVILHGTFGSKREGIKVRDRIIQTEGDEETLAGSRIQKVFIPEKYIMDPVDPWGQWCSFFKDEAAGLAAHNQFLGIKPEAAEESATSEDNAVAETETKPKPKRSK